MLSRRCSMFVHSPPALLLCPTERIDCQLGPLRVEGVLRGNDVPTGLLELDHQRALEHFSLWHGRHGRWLSLPGGLVGVHSRPLSKGRARAPCRKRGCS